MIFEWDPAKNEANLRKHGISFNESRHIFDGPILTPPVGPTTVKQRCTMTISRKRKKETVAIRDKKIDYGDIPETDAAFWADARLIEPDRTQHVTLRVKKSVLDHFKAGVKKGYQTRNKAVLESYVRAQEQKRDQHRGR